MDAVKTLANLGKIYRGRNSAVTYSAYKGEYIKLFEKETCGKRGYSKN